MEEPEQRKRRTRRPRRTTKLVRVVDRVARVLITLGGIGTIVAVATLCVFLLAVVVPLFLEPEAELTAAALPADAPHEPLAASVDEYLTLGWTCSQEAEVVSFRLADGGVLARRPLFEGTPPSALALRATEGTFVGGFPDGTVRLGRLAFATRFAAPQELGAELPELSAELEALAEGATLAHGSSVVERVPGGAYRVQEFVVSVDEPLAIGKGAEIRLVDFVETSSGPIFATVAADDTLRLSRNTRKTNLLTGAETFKLVQGELALELPATGAAPRWLLLSGLGDCAFLLWEDGALWRCDTRDLAAMRVLEKTDLLPEEGARVGAASFLIGRTSLAVGDTLGRVRVWFRIKPDTAGTADGVELALAHELSGSGAPVRALAPSARGRMLAAGYEDGGVRLFHVTSARELVALEAPGPLSALAIAPKDDALLAMGPQGAGLWRMRVPHPETSLAAIFQPVWYEGYESLEHVWQSSSGTDDFEPKYGLYPLVFGTIKATFYSLLFGVPIALLAAIYTSEFLHPRRKARVKPTIEMMASLPSVVLGFLSALVIAPLVEDVVPAVLLSLALVPAWVVLGGYLWRALPQAVGLRLERFRLGFVSLCLALGVASSSLLGAPLERWLFAGDIRQWLTGSVGSGTGGWMILFLPVVALAVAWFVIVWVNPRLARRGRELSRERFARLEIVKFLAGSVVLVGLLWALGATLTLSGFDPRGGMLDTYVQRNALVVGFVMGFAIIPIVFTIAEDALAAVPDHLRAASLGAGATTWQTTVRVVVPTAMSGIFSAVMIGFGRAVGETMIVLMAAGNTPIMDWNVFNGFRTLSANIAVELPEAAQGSTHYRMLFLAALVLFAMTFALNTAAEAVRMRYRRRRVQL